MAVLASGTSGDVKSTATAAWNWSNGLVVRPGTVVLVDTGNEKEKEKN